MDLGETRGLDRARVLNCRQNRGFERIEWAKQGIGALLIDPRTVKGLLEAMFGPRKRSEAEEACTQRSLHRGRASERYQLRHVT